MSANAFGSALYQMTKFVTKLKAFAGGKINVHVAQMKISVCDMIENIWGKGGNAGFDHFILFPQCFLKASFMGWLKSGSCGKDLNNALTHSHTLTPFDTPGKRAF